MKIGSRVIIDKFVSSIRRTGLIGTLNNCAEGIQEVRFDRKFGIDTTESTSDYKRGLLTSRHPAYNLWYEPTKIRTVRKILTNLPISYEDFIFLDFGSGKGRALLLASEYPFRRLIGLEISPELHSIAQKNISTYRSTTQKCSTIELICCDATLYQMPVENTVLFLPNTLKTPAIARLLTSLRESLLNHPRQLYFVCKSLKLHEEDASNPDCNDLIIEAGFLRFVSLIDSHATYNSVNELRTPPRST